MGAGILPKNTRKKSSKKNKTSSTTTSKRVLKYTAFCLLALFFAFVAYSVYLNFQVVNQFEGKRFSLPARVFARPLELYVRAPVTREMLEHELKLLRYSKSPVVDQAGQYSIHGDMLDIFIRPFSFWDESQPPSHIRLKLDSKGVEQLTDVEYQMPVDFIRLDPLVIGGIYPGAGEDRELVRLDSVPRDIVNALVAVEDKRFFEHYGVDPKAILRALSSIVTSDRIQGGSTITQQLVKNFYLTQARTLRRKFTEMIMALLLEYHYSKADILETYINEVFLGQDGDRAIHGFALASQFYFAKSLQYVELHEAALLVGILKGPTFYNPRKHAQRAKDRRDLVLKEMHEQGLISQESFLTAKSKTLGLSEKSNIGQSFFPAFQDLVVRQLREHYKEEDLRSEGLRIFTTLDPYVQRKAESTVLQRLERLEADYRLSKDLLEAAMVIADVSSGEVNALVGGKKAGYKGFNRAIDASRQIGSLIKPAMYLSAFQRGYHLTSKLDDSPFTWTEPGIEDWQPKNYDGEFHGDVPLWLAFAKSYNVAAARLGTEIGVHNVMDTVQRLGIRKTLPSYASGLLGTVHLTPFEVAQMYHTLATGGFKTPFRSIREVTTKDGQPLNRYNVRVEPAVDETACYLTVVGMQHVITDGTGKGLQRYLSSELNIAGKTGTTDDLRDSWFAGFSGDRIAVVWVGNDFNKSIRLTGASGALTIWGETMQGLKLKPLQVPVPENIAMLPIDKRTGWIERQNCETKFTLPFVLDSLAEEDKACLQSSQGKVRSWFKRIFGGSKP